MQSGQIMDDSIDPAESESASLDFSSSGDRTLSPIAAGGPSYIEEGGSHEASIISQDSPDPASDLFRGSTFRKFSERFSRCKMRHVELSEDKKRVQVSSQQSSFTLCQLLMPLPCFAR